MKQTCCRYFSLLPLALLLLLGWSAYLPTPVLATDLPVYGGPGGNEFRAECPKGSYLVGLTGRTGAWVDRIAPVCAPWLRGSQTLGAPSIGPSFGMSTEGEERQAICRGSGVNSLVAHSWTIAILRSDNHFVQYVWVNCATFAPLGAQGYMEGSFDFGSPPSAPPGDEKISNERVTAGPNKSQWTTDQSCPAGEVAVGIRVRAGQFVDAIGLICGPIPARAGAPTTKLPSPFVQADLFVIVKPRPGDKIPHGQLVITATPPKVGATNVTELELRYLDAPPTQRGSYPYVTVFSVDTAKLLAGRWEVRARSSMKAVPGRWSFPVQFQMVKAQPPPPMVQMPKLNAPITQTPAPNTGVAPSMVRPPTTSSGGAASSLMIRPRGVDEKGGIGGNETIDRTPETEKKP